MDMSAMSPGAKGQADAMADMPGMDHGTTAVAAQNSPPVAGDHGAGSMGMRDPRNAPQVKLGPGVQTIAPMPVDRTGEPGQGLADAGHKVLVYRDLVALDRNPDVRAPARQIEVRVEPPRGFSDAVGAQGRIGTGLLQRYRVLLDPRAGRMVFTPGPDADQPPVRSTSGLLLGLDKDRLRVVHVMRGSPAAAAGWRSGDLICRIDGKPIPADYADSALSSWSTGTPGRTVTLGLCDGATRSLTLRQFY